LPTFTGSGEIAEAGKKPNDETYSIKSIRKKFFFSAKALPNQKSKKFAGYYENDNAIYIEHRPS
jgi:hypothetical protein